MAGSRSEFSPPPDYLKRTGKSEVFASASNINVEYFGIQDCPPGHTWESTRHHFVIHIVTKGKGILYVRSTGLAYHIHERQAFLMRPDGQIYKYSADEKEPWTYAWIAFSGIRAGEYVENMGFDKEHWVIDVANARSMYQKISDMVQYDSLNCLDELHRLDGLVELLIMLLENNREKVEKTKRHSYPGQVYVNYIMQYINENYSDRISLSELSGKIGISRSYMAHIFRDAVHQSPKEYLTSVRMTNAEKLLQNSDATIGEVARACGYDDALAFSKAFHKVYEMSPSEFRKSSRFSKEFGDGKSYFESPVL